MRVLSLIDDRSLERIAGAGYKEVALLVKNDKM